ncbi:hypothetical protein ACROYT_G033401 [Oculina patagonica]
MAGLSRTSTSSRSGRRRESFEETNQGEPLAFNKQFIELLRKLPDYLMRLEQKINKLERELRASPTRDDLSSKKIEKLLKVQWETKENELNRKHEERVLQLRKGYEQQLKNSTEILQKNNTELQNLLKESVDIATQKAQENETLKQKVKECERQLQGRVSISPKYSRHTDRFTDEQQLVKTKQALEEKRRELERFKERHAAFSERRVRSDQRRTENTLSTNRQSQLESEYVIDFKDGTRVDAIDIITTRVGRLRGAKVHSMEYLKCCRLACFIFETAYEVVLKVKESFASFTSTLLEILAADAPAIGSDNKAYQSKLWTLQYNRPKETSHTRETEDALSEVMILVKERAKTHDLNFLVQDVKSFISAKWNRHHLRDHLLLDYDSILLHGLSEYIAYCTRFAWCAVTQVPPLKIDYSTAVYSSRSHMPSQAFTEERSPTRRSAYSESQSILCYLWPTLQDCDGKVIRQGEVVLKR